MRFACFPDLPDSCEVFVKRELDHPEDEILKDWLRPGDLVVDAGANVGLYTWRAHHFLCGKGKFVSIDASKRICGYLTESVRMTGVENVHIDNCALGDEEKEVEFYEAPPGRFAVEQSLRIDAARTHMRPVKTLMRTLGGVPCVKEYDSCPALLKLDIEGAEVMALSGAPRDWFSERGPLWIVEINPAALARFSATPHQVLRFFPENEFRRILIPKCPKVGGSPASPRACHADEQFAESWFYNLVAVPNGAARKLQVSVSDSRE